jgi:hypothetical protein
VQHQRFSRVSASATYYHRDYRDVRWTDNVLTTQAAYRIIEIPDPRGNGLTIPIYNLNPAKVGQVKSIDLTSDVNRSSYNGFDVGMVARLAKGASLIVGFSAGLIRGQICQVDDPNNLRFCDQRTLDIRFDKTVKLAGSYALPWGISASAVFQGVPGLPRLVPWVVGRTQVPTLTLSSVVVPLYAAGGAFLPRLNQRDVKLGKTVRYRTLRFQPQVGIFDLANSATVLAQNKSYGPTLDQVRAILDGRVVRLGLQLDF